MLESTASFISQEMQTLLETQWFLLANWKWLGLLGGITLVYFLNKILRLLIYKFKKQLISKNEKEKTFLTYFIEQSIEKGLSWIIAGSIGLVILENLELTPRLDKYLFFLLKVTISGHILRLAYFAADASGLLIEGLAQKANSKLDQQVAPLATKSLKVIVLVIGVLVILQNFGVNVTALLAGLGLGGVAIAFAAQDTVANVFGTITILLDSPFKVGERIKVQDVEGTVEEVGFRSTRIRTITNTLVTLSNSVMAKEKIENFSQRENLFRFRHVLGFTYNSKIEQLEQFVQTVKYFLKQDAQVMQDRTVVQVLEYGESSINILIQFHFKATDQYPDSEMIQNYLLAFHKLSSDLKLEFAFPTRTLFIEKSSESLANL